MCWEYNSENHRFGDILFNITKHGSAIWTPHMSTFALPFGIKSSVDLSYLLVSWNANYSVRNTITALFSGFFIWYFKQVTAFFLVTKSYMPNLPAVVAFEGNFQKLAFFGLKTTFLSIRKQQKLILSYYESSRLNCTNENSSFLSHSKQYLVRSGIPNKCALPWLSWLSSRDYPSLDPPPDSRNCNALPKKMYICSVRPRRNLGIAGFSQWSVRLQLVGLQVDRTL